MVPGGSCWFSGGFSVGGNLRPRGPEHPVPWGGPSTSQPLRGWGSCGEAEPRGCPSWCPWPSWAGGCSQIRGPELSFRLSPREWLFLGAARGTPGSLGTEGLRSGAGAGQEPRRGAGRPTIAQPDAGAQVGGLQCHPRLGPRGAPSELGGQGAEEDVLERWRCPVLVRVEWPGMPWAMGHHGAEGQRGSPGTTQGHATGLLGEPGSQQAPAKALEQDRHGDNGQTDGQGCGWRLCGRTAASSWLLGF